MEEIANKCKYAAFPSLYLKEWMGSHYQAYLEKGIVIPHQLNKEIENSIWKGEDRSFGIHSTSCREFLQARQPNGLIDGFKKFVSKKPDARVKLIHIGPAPHYKEYLEKEAKDETRIEVFCESHPFNEVLWLQDKAAINIIIEAKAEFSPFYPENFHIV